MRKNRLLWQLYLSYLLVILVSLLAVTIYSSYTYQKFHFRQAIEYLKNQAFLLENQIVSLVSQGKKQALANLSTRTYEAANLRLSIILPDGRVLCDSLVTPAKLDNHRNRPEVKESLQGKITSSVRFSQTLQKELMYVAIPVTKNEQMLAVARLAVPTESLHEVFAHLYLQIFVEGLMIAILTALLSLYISRRFTRPLETMKKIAERFAQGDFSARLPEAKAEETDSLARAMNQMARQLDERIRMLMRERNEHQAVLSSMVEGVLAVDGNGDILNLNQAAAKLFRLPLGESKGKNVKEILNQDLQKLIKTVLEDQKTLKTDLIMEEQSDGHLSRTRVLQVHGSVLRETDGSSIGALIVIHDVTSLKKLEKVRSDFVANVSHELKTPITSIKGFVETLLDGAIENPEETGRFLKIIARQSDRLNLIIEDLLSLSRIELESHQGEVKLIEDSIKPPIENAIQMCQLQAAEKDITIKMHIPQQETIARINSQLLEQALINLIQNAMKYSNPGKTVQVEAETREDEIAIHVKDQGYGIETEHISRIFERFYRVDKARSRKLGGTGLGLAIVKHIVLAHKGTVKVDSVVGEGSCFSIILPRAI